MIRLAQNKSNVALAPALVETYSRLLVYMEIESLGIKGFISKFTKHMSNNPLPYLRIQCHDVGTDISHFDSNLRILPIEKSCHVMHSRKAKGVFLTLQMVF